MKNYTPEDLKDILAKHKAWLERGGFYAEDRSGRADLRNAGLSRADLSGAYLRNANLSDAYLRNANLSDANLSGAYLRNADLSGAGLRGADLSRADLSGANLSRADLSRADLAKAVLPTGDTWEKYLSDVVPALLKAGGREISEILSEGAWECNDWQNCPMACAFKVHKIEDCPILLKPRVEQFIQFFDAHLIPKPEVSK